MTTEEKKQRERERLRRYYAANKEKRRAYDRHRYRNDPHRRLSHQLRLGYSRAVEAGCEAHQISPQELLQHWEQRGINPLRCYLTGAKLSVETGSIDHATPISRGGGHVLENLRPCTFTANNKKQHKLPEELLI